MDKIGYGNPPKATRFAKGKSGNPKGRPKGSRNTYKLLDDILEQKITMMQEGKPIRISKKMAILLQAVNSAVKGDLKAIQNLFPHLLAVDARQEEKEQKISSLKQDDMEILNSFFNHKEKKMEFKIKTNTNTTNNKIITEFLDFACNRTEAKKAIKDFAQMFGKMPSGQKKTVQEFLWALFQETNKIRPIHIAKVNTAYQKVPELEVTKIEHLIEELEKAPERSCKKIIDIAKEELEEKETENQIRTASASLREEKLRLCNRGRLPNLSRKIFLQTVWESLMAEEAMSERRW